MVRTIVTVINDPIPSAFQLHWDVKGVLWGIVDRIEIDARRSLKAMQAKEVLSIGDKSLLSIIDDEGDPIDHNPESNECTDDYEHEHDEKDIVVEDESGQSDDDIEVDVQQTNMEGITCVPIEFGGKKKSPAKSSKKRKAKGKSLSSLKSHKKFKGLTSFNVRLNSPAFGHPPMFDNLYLVYHFDGNYYPAVCIGQGNKIPIMEDVKRGDDQFAPVSDKISDTPEPDSIAASQAASYNKYKGCDTAIVKFLGADKNAYMSIRHPDFMRPIPDDLRDEVKGAVLAEAVDNPAPEELICLGLEKYWDQRYRLCSKFDRGIQLDEESWYSITAESIANHVAVRCLVGVSKLIAKSHSTATEFHCNDHQVANIYDFFSGCGGNLIALSRILSSQEYRIRGVELDPIKVGMCRSNAKVYDVDVDVECADIYDVITRLRSELGLLADEGNPPPEMDKKISVIERKVPTPVHIRFDDDNVVEPTRADDTSLIQISSDNLASSMPKYLSQETNQTSLVDQDLHAVMSSDEELTAMQPLDESLSKVITTSKPIDVLVMSPPWGGPDYAQAKHFRMNTMLTCGDGDGVRLTRLIASVCDNMIQILPRNILKREFGCIAKELKVPCVIEEIYMYDKHKLSIVYLGPMFKDIQ